MKPKSQIGENKILFTRFSCLSAQFGDEALGRHAITELLKVARPATFGCIKGKEVAKRMGLLKEDAK